MKKILILVGTRPNFIKVTRFKELAKHHPGMDIRIVHTGQHFDKQMADVFFEQFDLQPDYFLNIPATSPNSQMAEIMTGLERLFQDTFRPDLLIVPGDVNSTLAGALAANKCGIRLAHLESGLRSHDRSMPEEINRILTDQISDFYFVTEQSGIDHIRDEKLSGKVFFVGNTMIDTLVHHRDQIQRSAIKSDLGVDQQPYVLMTIHRPSNVDNEEGLRRLLDLISFLQPRYKVVFPIHPRTVKRLEQFGLKSELEAMDNLIQTDPLGYFEFQKLISEASLILTDSGGIQEESTFCGIPCLTLRDNTERPVTVTLGTNTLVPFDLETIQSHIKSIEEGKYKKGAIPPLWDGDSTKRILEILESEI
jgi:UDP-N-acetylglucosamine 2-epimerase (non-hydrolysing)